MILQSYIAQFRTSIRKPRNNQWLALNVTQALKTIGMHEVAVSDDVSKLIDDLRGLNGISAKRLAFNLVISWGSYTHDQLLAMFPVYTKE